MKAAKSSGMSGREIGQISRLYATFPFTAPPWVGHGRGHRYVAPTPNEPGDEFLS